jgi:hypothetical protein
MTYTIEVTKEQLATLSMACEITARLGICQIDMAFDEMPFREPVDWSAYHAMMDDIRRQLRVHCDANLGIRSAKDRHKEAWDLYQVFRHRLAWDRLADEGKTKPDMCLVIYDEPFKTADQPLAKIERKTP